MIKRNNLDYEDTIEALLSCLYALSDRQGVKDVAGVLLDDMKTLIDILKQDFTVRPVDNEVITSLQERNFDLEIENAKLSGATWGMSEAMKMLCGKGDK